MKTKKGNSEFNHTSSKYVSIADVCDVCNIRIYYDYPCNSGCVYYEFCQKHNYNQDYIMSLQKE